jgi:hypothetical protein
MVSRCGTVVTQVCHDARSTECEKNNYVTVIAEKARICYLRIGLHFITFFRNIFG